MAGNVKLMTSAGGGVVLDTATTTATDVTVKVPVTGVNNGTLVCSDSSGNVGIGTISPAYKEEVVVSNSGAETTALQVRNDATADNTAVAIRFTTSTSATSTAAAEIAGLRTTGGVSNLVFRTSSGSTPAERMRIDSSGNLLVGKTSAASAVQGHWFAPDGVWRTSKDGTGSNNHAVFINNAAGTPAAVGSITTSGSTTAYNTSSDYRLKENIQPMQNALATVAQLNPVTYTWKADGSDGQGFIAHELQAVVPDCVTGEKDAVDEEGNPVYQGIDTSFLVATLTKAIQELNEKVEAQAAEIAALKGAA